MSNQSRVGKMNKDQSSSQYSAQSAKNMEASEELTIGNTKSQSQKKSGRQLNKKKNS